MKFSGRRTAALCSGNIQPINNMNIDPPSRGRTRDPSSENTSAANAAGFVSAVPAPLSSKEFLLLVWCYWVLQWVDESPTGIISKLGAALDAMSLAIGRTRFEAGS